MNANNSLIILLGPTAIGKTALSIAIAKQFNCPILSADSRQFYKEMSIGTAKPSKKEMEGIPHYFINSHSIKEEYNVVKYETEVINLLDQLFQTNSFVVLVGGSGLYIDAISKGFDSLPPTSTETRKKVNKLLEDNGIEALQVLLKELDPVYYKQVDLNNKQRVSRAIEVCFSSEKKYSELRKGETTKRNFNSIKIGLNADRQLLYERINARVDTMMEAGLLEEVKKLVPYKHLNSLQTVGYKELFDYIEGNIDLDTAISLIKQNTRRFAKRQLTWFRRDEEIEWFEPEQFDEIINTIKKH